MVAGLLIGGMLPYLFGSMGMQAWEGGGAVVIEVRNNLKKFWNYEEKENQTMGVL